jgi:hypothetical protein
MSGAPGFQEIERFSPAHLANWDTIRAQSQGGADEIGQRRDAILRAQRHQIRSLALKLTCILDQDHAVGGLRHLGEQGVDERRLAGRRPTSNEYIAAFLDREL